MTRNFREGDFICLKSGNIARITKMGYAKNPINGYTQMWKETCKLRVISNGASGRPYTYQSYSKLANLKKNAKLISTEDCLELIWGE